MSKPNFVYVIYINATPESVWAALQDPEMTRQYWFRHRNESSWTPGASWEHQNSDDPSKVGVAGVVLEVDPPHRLVLTWAAPSDLDNPEKVSKVTFDIQPSGDYVCLTVTHEDLEPDSSMLKGITKGWPMVLSNLKTMLETGKPLPGSA